MGKEFTRSLTICPLINPVLPLAAFNLFMVFSLLFVLTVMR